MDHCPEMQVSVEIGYRNSKQAITVTNYLAATELEVAELEATRPLGEGTLTGAEGVR